MQPTRAEFVRGSLAGSVLPAFGAVVQAHVSIAVGSHTNGRIDSTSYVGLSWEKEVVGLGTFDATNTDLVALFRRLGPSELRIGGYTVDTNVWDPAGPGGVLGQTSRADLARLAGFVSAIGWTVRYGLRYKNADVVTLVDEAAAAFAILGAALTGYEIGNEPDGYVEEPTFAATWEAYRLAVLARVPSATFMAPATAGADRFFSAFAQQESGRFSTLAAHHYTGAASDPKSTVERLLHSQETAFLGVMQRTRAQSKSPFYRVGETNSLYGGGKDGVSNAFASALWAIRYLLDGARFDCAGYNFHGGTSTEFGHELYYSPIRLAGTTGKTVIGVQPIYYGMLFVVLLGTGPSFVTTVSGSANVVAYAIGRNVAIVNLDRSAYDVTVALPAPIAAARGIVLRTRGGAGATHGQTLGGSTVGLDGRFAPAFFNVPVSGATLTLRISGITATLVRTS